LWLKEIEGLNDQEIHARINMYQMNMRIMRREYNEVEHQCAEFQVKIKDNEDKIKQNKVLPYLVAHIVEV